MAKRLTAHKIRAADILSADFVKGVGEFDSDFIIVNGAKVSRVNLIGFAVDKNTYQNFESLKFDDGTGVVDIRNFGKGMLTNFSVGDCVNIIGKVKDFGNMRYVVCESCKKIDRKWILYRKKELEAKDFMSAEKLVVDKNQTEEDEQQDNNKEFITASSNDAESVIEEDVEENPVESLINTIRSLDKGDGVDIDDIIKLKGEKTENMIVVLLEQGELFEIRPGRIKILE